MDVLAHVGLVRCVDCGKLAGQVTRGGRCFPCVARLQVSASRSIAMHKGPAYKKWRAGMRRAAK